MAKKVTPENDASVEYVANIATDSAPTDVPTDVPTDAPTDVIVLSKLSVANIGANAKAILAFPPESKEVNRLALAVGQASGLKHVEDKVRGVTHCALLGNFEFTNLASGKLFRSGVCYLPPGVHDMVVSAVKSLEDESQSVTFALEISTVRDSCPAGYTYQSRNLIPVIASDPLTELRKAIGYTT